MNVEFYAKIAKGKFSLVRPDVFKGYCLGRPDGNYVLTVKKVKDEPKTIEQLGFYYAAIIPAVFRKLVEDGNDTFVVKVGKGNEQKFAEVTLTEDVVDKLLKERCAKFDGKSVTLKRDMSKEEASWFIDRVIRWCATYLGLIIPETTERDLKPEQQ